MADIVEDMLKRLAQHAPDLSVETRARLEQETRLHWGGSEVYVAKRISRSTRTSLLAHGLREQLPLREAFAKAGTSRSTGYRLLSRKAR